MAFCTSVMNTISEEYKPSLHLLSSHKDIKAHPFLSLVNQSYFELGLSFILFLLQGDLLLHRGARSTLASQPQIGQNFYYRSHFASKLVNVSIF